MSDNEYPKLPTFEGLVPDTAAVTFTGGAEGTPPHIDAYAYGHAVAFLVLGEVGDITHGHKGGEKDRRYVRSHKVVVDRVIPLNHDEAQRFHDEVVERFAAEHPRPGSLDDAVRDFTDALGKGTSATVSHIGADGEVRSVTVEGTDPDEDREPFLYDGDLADT